MSLRDLLKESGRESQLINGVGISTAINGIGTIIMAIIVGKMSDSTGEYDDAQVLSGAMVMLAGLLAVATSPISKSYRHV